MLWANLLYLFLLSFQPVCTGWVGKSQFAMLPVRVYVLMNLAVSCSYILLEQAIIHSTGCNILKVAISESRKEQWTIAVMILALAISFIPGLHYASCPLLIVAMGPWIVPDLRMKRVFEEAQRKQDVGSGGE